MHAWSQGRSGTIELQQLSTWYRALSCGRTNYESVYTWMTHLHIAVPIITRSYATRNPQVKKVEIYYIKSALGSYD